MTSPIYYAHAVTRSGRHRIFRLKRRPFEYNELLRKGGYWSWRFYRNGCFIGGETWKAWC